MKKTNTLEEVKTQMKELKDRKSSDLNKISQMQKEVRENIDAAFLAMKNAAEVMDVEAYEKAQKAKDKAHTAFDMYRERYKQIAEQEYISEAESDKVIDSLLAYEDQLEADFKEASAEILRKLNDLLNEYLGAVQDTEQTLTAWQEDIHANYNTRGSTAYYDEFTGTHTNRSPKPVPVHPLGYVGCSEATIMAEYLKKAAPLYDVE